MLIGISGGALLAAFSAGHASAYSLKWNDSTGNWFDINRWIWDGRVPVAGDLVHQDGGTISIFAGQNAAAAGTIYLGVGDAVMPVSPTAHMSIDGTLTTTNAYIGYNFDGAGQVAITGPTANWSNTGAMVIGELGTGIVDIYYGSLNTGTVRLGGSATGNTGSGEVGIYNGGQWIANGDISVGNFGTGLMTILDGEVQSRFGLIGHQVGGDGTVVVQGANSTWTNSGVLFVGNAGKGTLNVLAGGTVSSTDGYVGTELGSAGSTATISGVGSKWTSSQDVFVGHNSGASGEVTVENGGAITAARYAILGDLFGSFGKMTVTGSGSSVTAQNGDFNVGRLGDGELTIGDGGLVQVNGGNVYLGNETNSSGKMLISGADARLSAQNKVFVGAGGDGALRLANGGKVSATQIDIAYSTGTTGTLTIGGASGMAAESAGIVDAQTIVFYRGDNGSSPASTGSIVVNTTDALDLSADISGKGQLILEHGELLLSGTNTYSGGTTVTEGVLTLGTSSAAGSGVIALANGTTLGYANGVDIDNDLYINGTVDLRVATGTATQFGDITIANGGLYRLTGNGTLLLEGSIGGSGQTSVSDGTVLSVNGTLGGEVIVGNDGTLKGHGTIGDMVVNSGGMVAPGNSIGTLTVVGDATFNAGSVYEVEVDPTSSDRINATGTAFINGGTVEVLATPGAYAPSKTYTILTSGNRIGTFDAVTSNLAFLVPTLSYDATSVNLVLTRNGVGFADVGTTPNQVSTGGALSAFGAGNPLYNGLVGMSAPDAQAALDMLSGDIHPSMAGVLTNGSAFIRDAGTNRIDAALTDANAAQGATAYVASASLPAPEVARVGVWGQFYGGLGFANGRGNANAIDAASGGLLAGADTLIGDWAVGVVAQAGTTRSETGNGASAQSTDYGVSAYGGTEWGDTRLALGASYMRHDIDTSRTVILPGLAESLTASYGAATVQIFGELSHEFDFGATSLTPFVGLAYVHHGSDAYVEQGGAAALSNPGFGLDAGFVDLGLRGDYAFILGDETLVKARAELGWRHAFADVPTASQALAGGDTFAIAGAPITADAAVIGAGLDFGLGRGTRLDLGYDAQLSFDTQAHAFKAKFASAF